MISVMLYLLCSVRWDAWKCVAPLEVKKLIYAHLEPVVTKYGAANYWFKISRPFEVFWNNRWGFVWFQKQCASLHFPNLYYIFAIRPHFFSYFDLKWSMDFLDTLYKLPHVRRWKYRTCINSLKHLWFKNV